MYLDDSLDVVHDHGGFHRHTGHTHGETSLPLKVIYLLKQKTNIIVSPFNLIHFMNLLRHWVYTFEASWSTLSATFPTDNRISVLCCRASVIKKEVTSLEPEENNTTTIRHKTNCTTFSISHSMKHYINLTLFWFDCNVFVIIELSSLTHVGDSLCRVHLANRLQLRSHRGLCVGVRLWNNTIHWYKKIILHLPLLL